MLGIRCFTENGGEITESYENYEKVIVQNQWIRISNTFNLPIGTKSFFVILRSNGRDNNTVKFDAVRLEEKSMVISNTISSPTNSEIYNRAGATITNSYTYENDRIKTISHNGFSYKFEYDGLGRNKKVFVESQVLIENDFEQSTGNLLQSIYGGNANQKINIDYDNLDRVISRKFNGEERYKYGYTNSGNLGYHEDKVNNKSYRYTYDLSDRLVKAEEFSGATSNINYSKFGYDKNNNHSKITQKINGNLYETKYGYDKDNKPLELLYGISPEDNINVEYFPLSGSTVGSKGTLPVTQTPVFEKDENDETVLSAKVGTKVVYNLGINKTSGTMTSWFTETGKGTRMILASEGASGQLLNLYVGENEWNFVAIKWQFAASVLTCTLYFNSKAYTATAKDFKDFTGIQTAVGSTASGRYPLNGLSKKFSYSSSALSENEILTMYYKNIVNYSYDILGRMNSKTTNTGLFSYKSEYTYVSGTATNSTTSKVASIKNNNGVPITYEYDANGNIKKITQGIMNITYYYNELNELIQEDNQVLNKTMIYSYDAGGNLMSKLEIIYGVVGNTTITYEYDSIWKDKLLKYNGKPITYDAIGNPLTYDGYTYTWEEGRQLKTIIGNGKNISYKYNDAGIRTEKIVDGVTTKYYLLGSRVAYETNGTDIIYYTYDDSSNLLSMNLNGIEYYYIRNAQGDIIGLFDKNGTQVVSYVYDSWGKLISITGTLAATVGVKNPYRYRGYRYDTETGLYYLGSRYYNPEWGRFINADGIAAVTGELLSANMFVYCKDNPTTLKDPSGFRPIYTQGEETDAMMKSSYKVMNTAASLKASTKSAENKKLKSTGESNSHGLEYDENGKLHKERWYGPDGKMV
jgi:RHS repeat-associated protein